MTVLITVPDTSVGGITAAAVNLTRELVQRGHEVSFLDMSGALLCKDRLPEEVKCLSLSGRSTLWSITAATVQRQKGARRVALLLLGLIKKLTIRSGLWYKLIFGKDAVSRHFDVAIAFRQCAPCYHFVQHCVTAKQKLAFVHGELAYMGDISSWKHYLSAFDRVAYVSESVRREFVTVFPELRENSATVYNMFDGEAIRELANAPSTLPDSGDKRRIVTVARIDCAFKRIDRIVEVCRILKEKNSPPFHWYIVGAGPDLDALQTLAKEKGVLDVLTFLGHRDNPFPVLRVADFTVLSSKSEAYPMVVMESLILGVPVLTTRFGAAEEMIRENEYGWIVEQSTEALADKVFSLLKNEDGALDHAKGILQSTVFDNKIPYEQFLTAVGEIQ